MHSEIAWRHESTWRAWLLRIARGWTCCEADAEDLVQDCLHAFERQFGYYPWQSLLDGNTLQRAKGWLKRKLQWLVLDRLEQPHLQRELPLLDTPSGEYLAVQSPETEWVLHIAVEQFVNSLPDYLRRVAELYNVGYDCGEIAEALQLSAGTVRQYLQRIKRFGQAFFGIDVHKSAGSGVNKSRTPEKGVPNLSEEDSSDEKGFEDVDDY